MIKKYPFEMPSVNQMNEYVLEAGLPYWFKNRKAIEELSAPSVNSTTYRHDCFPQVVLIKLPGWAEDIGVAGKLLVPIEAIQQNERANWKNTNWFYSAFWYLSGFPESCYENVHGAIHSYSTRLKNWPTKLWDHAWCNRIFLFLRRWAAQKNEREEDVFFGPLPEPCIILTHDVDAVEKTIPAMLKQTVFRVFNSFRKLLALKPRSSIQCLMHAINGFRSTENFWCFDRIQEIEAAARVRSTFNFSGLNSIALKGKTLKWRLRSWLMDPLYNVKREQMQDKLNELYSGGWQIGLHPCFDSWDKQGLIAEERAQLEQAARCKVTICRQHWLRFSWRKTWRAQEKAGLKTDLTLGFNDRPGFRCGVALKYHPWNPQTESSYAIKVVPTILMDSHLYDYRPLNRVERQQEIDKWLAEIKAVHGIASVIWHQRVFSSTYGWQEGYEQLLSAMDTHRVHPFLTAEPSH